MASHESVVSVEINARRRQLAVKTLMSGSGRHRLYQNFGQLAPHLRGEALGIVRQAVLAAGYASLAELEARCAENALLAAGFDVVRRRVNCRFNWSALQTGRQLEPPLRFMEGYMPERHPRDNPHSAVVCDACYGTGMEGFILEGRHPDECDANTRWFPHPPE